MLLTTPLTLNDGTTDQIFNWLMQLVGQQAGSYVNQAADPSLPDTIRSYHQATKANGKRHTVSLSRETALVNPSSTDPATAPIILSISLQHHTKHAQANISKAKAMGEDLYQAIDVGKLLRGEI